MRHYKLKLNPAKYAFGVPAGKLLGFIVNIRGIELEGRCFDKMDWKMSDCFWCYQELSIQYSVLVPPREGSPLLLYLSISIMYLDAYLVNMMRHGRKRESYTTYLISRMDPLKYIFQMAMLIENLAKGQMFFDLKVDKSASLGWSSCKKSCWWRVWTAQDLFPGWRVIFHGWRNF